MARKVQVEMEIEPYHWAALEVVAKGSDCTVEDALEGCISTALDDLAITESPLRPYSPSKVKVSRAIT